MKTFIPFVEIKKYPEQVIVVDAYHPQAFNLSHWRGAPVPEECAADTSTEIVLNALEKNLPELQRPYVTNNHYDIDGFLGVWAIFNPQLALKNKKLLIEMAQIGDFREIDFNFSDWEKALKLVCWLNQEEALLFYPPFGAPELAQKEMEASVPKYEHFLGTFARQLNNSIQEIPSSEEYKSVLNDLNLIKNNTLKEELRINIVEAASPIHYYALYSQSAGADMVISIYPENRYELEFKYTTWIHSTRKHFPRVNLKPLCEQLNRLEASDRKWEAEHFTDTAPILRLKGKELNKKERYQSPNFRPIYPSSIEKEEFLSVCLTYFRDIYRSLEKGDTLSWSEVRAINDRLLA